MSKVTEWSNEELISNIRQWEIDSVNDVNNFVGKPITDINTLSGLVKGLVDDNRFLLGVVSELAKRTLNKDASAR